MNVHWKYISRAIRALNRDGEWVDSPEIVLATKHEMRFEEEGGADLSQTTVATRALETVFVPAQSVRLQQVPLRNFLTTTCQHTRRYVTTSHYTA